MTQHRSRIKSPTSFLIAFLVAALVSGPGVAGHASAAGPWDEMEGDVYTEVMEDFCDVRGLTVQLQTTASGREKWTPRGPFRLPYRMEHSLDTSVYINVDTGASVTEVERRNENMLRVIDNGDGTITYVETNVHQVTMYDQAGRAIAHRTGQLTVVLTFDHAGTPTDPSDDEELVSIDVPRFSTHGDDFCTAAVAAIG